MLTCTLDSRSSTPLYEQLYLYIKEEIMNGHLRAKEKLPSKRTLCAHLKVSQNTVETAYAQLTAEGYVFSKPKSGYYVQTMGSPLIAEPHPAAFCGSTSQAKAMPKPSALPRYDFRTNEVDTDRFPFSAWAKLSRETLCEDSRHLLEAIDPQGDEGLRAEIARYLHDFRGIEASPDRIIVGAGSEYLLGLAVQLLGREKLYAVENPGYLKIRKILGGNGAKTVSIPLDENGIRPDKLIDSGAEIVHVTPSHHFPLGIIMPAARRQQLLHWAAEADGRFILEDDYDSEFRFSGRPIPALQGLDRSGRVIYFNTFAKSLAPSLRIGYMVLPVPLLEIYLRDFRFYSSTVPSFEQITLRRFLHDGYFERHLSRMRNVYKAQRDRLLQEIGRYNRSRKITVSGQDTGLHLLLRVENGMSETQLVASALAAGVKVYGLSGYCSEPADVSGSHIVLGYAGFPPDDIADAVARLAKAWKINQ